MEAGLESKLDGLELKITRIRAGLRQYELAAKIGIPPNRLCEMELGRRPIAPELAEKIARLLNEAERVRANG